MKNLTLLAAMAVCGMGVASAQYTKDAGIAATDGEVYDIVALDQTTIDGLKSAGKTVNLYTIDDLTRHLYVWDNTFIANDPVGPGVDGQFDGYTSLAVSTVGWSGYGVSFDGPTGANGDGSMNTSNFSENTRFHIALKSSNEPAAIAITLFDGTEAGFTKATVSFGSTQFDDNGTKYPLVGDFDEGGDWVALDISLGDLKKLVPAFNYSPAKFYGNVYSILAGGVAGKTIDVDAVYFYGPKAGEGGVGEVAANDITVLVTGKTINVAGNGNNGFELYNLQGQLVKASQTSTMGAEDLNAGLYIVKAGNVSKKVVIK